MEAATIPVDMAGHPKVKKLIKIKMLHIPIDSPKLLFAFVYDIN